MKLLLTLTLSLLLIGTEAFADPCEGRVTGFKPGSTVSGQVRYVGDGDSLCVGNGYDPKLWTEVRLADFNAPELNEKQGQSAKEALRRVTEGKRVVCTATRGRNGRTVSYDRLIAVCRINNVSLGELMRRAGVVQGGR